MDCKDEKTPLLKPINKIREKGKINMGRLLVTEIITKQFNINYKFVITCSNCDNVIIYETINGAIVEIMKPHPTKKSVLEWIAM